MQMALRLTTFYRPWKFESYVLNTFGENCEQAKNKLVYISGPEVTNKKYPGNIVTHFVQNKIWKFRENQLKRFWENVTEKKPIIIRHDLVASNEKVFCLIFRRRYDMIDSDFRHQTWSLKRSRKLMLGIYQEKTFISNP